MTKFDEITNIDGQIDIANDDGGLQLLLSEVGELETGAEFTVSITPPGTLFPSPQTSCHRFSCGPLKAVECGVSWPCIGAIG